MKQQIELIKLKEKLPRVILLLLIALMLNVYDGQSQHYKVVLMLGQSNMVGHGRLSDFRSSGYPAGAANHYIWADIANPDGSGGYAFRGDYALRRWRAINDGAQFGYGTNIQRHGCEYGLSNQLKIRYSSTTFAFIKIAAGGSSLYFDWRSAPDNLVGVVYSRFKTNFNSIMDNAIASLPYGATIEVVGILWMQGETDATTRTMKDGYFNNLTYLKFKIRNLINNKPGIIHRSQPIPFITGVITDKTSLQNKCTGQEIFFFPQYLNEVGQIQRSVMNSDPRGAYIETKHHPRTCNYDIPIHYNSVGLTQMGVDFANKLATFYPISKTGSPFQEEEKEALEVLIYPNPVEDVMQITLDRKELQNVSINILNTNNQIIKQINVKMGTDTKNIKIDMAKITNGIYILQILNNGVAISTSKIIKLNNK